MVTAQPADDPASLARCCWDDLHQRYVRLGLWSLRSLTLHLQRQCPDLAPSTHSTLNNWFKHCKRLPDKLAFLTLVEALKLDKQEWSQRWEEWDRARAAAARHSTESAPTELQSLSTGTGISRNADTSSEIYQSPVCAKVVSEVAFVFPAPNDEPYRKIAKYLGDQVILFTGKSDIVGSDGRRYRAIRSPARANPGLSPYSWMLADDLAEAPSGPLGSTEN